jgi:hypothetical protein
MFAIVRFELASRNLLETGHTMVARHFAAQSKSSQLTRLPLQKVLSRCESAGEKV